MRILRAVILLLLLPAWIVSAQEGEPKFVDFYADSGTPVQMGDSTALKLKGNVVFYHNGAVVTCDSAIRYNNMHMDCFGQVVINQNSTYVYGDRAEYNGVLNMARVYAPIIKIVDEDATMYTRNFEFNTLDKVGHYFGGGTMQQQENFMESRQGYYYADKRELVAVDDVEMRNPDYQLESDSVAYNMDTEVASFFTKTYIWTAQGEILSASEGSYDNLGSVYRFNKEAYIYDGEKELWADSLLYNSIEENVWLYGNIQMLDNDQGAMGFGDYGQYWGDPQNGLLTQNPSLVSLDREKGDTLFLSADSIYLYTFDRDLVLNATEQPKQNVAAGEELITPVSGRTPADAQGVRHEEARQLLDSLKQASAPPAVSGDSTLNGETLQVLGDTLITTTTTEAIAEDLVAVPEPAELTREERRRIRDEEKRIAKEAKEEARRQKQAERDAKLLAKRRERLGRAEEEHRHDHAVADTLSGGSTASLADSSAMVPDSSAVGGAPQITPREEGDSLQRVFMAYYDVKIFRGDVQAVCDSLVGFSKDSTLHMYIEPVLWNGSNQLTAEVIDVYMRDGELHRAFFSGDPLMVSEVEPGNKYNQVKGRTMQSLFRDNEIYRHDVDANARTLYYMQDEDTGDYMGLINVESAEVSFFIENMEMQDIVWRGDPVYTIYPMDKIPATVELELPGFAWHGERKPTRAEVFDRTIRASEKDVYDSMARPSFPLTQALLRSRANMISSGQWVERNDRLTARTIEWIRTVDPDYGREPEDEIVRGGSNTIVLPAGPEAKDILSDSLTAPVDTLRTQPGDNPAGEPSAISDSIRAVSPLETGDAPAAERQIYDSLNLRLTGDGMEEAAAEASAGSADNAESVGVGDDSLK